MGLLLFKIITPIAAASLNMDFIIFVMYTMLVVVLRFRMSMIIIEIMMIIMTSMEVSMITIIIIDTSIGDIIPAISSVVVAGMGCWR